MYGCRTIRILSLFLLPDSNAIYPKKSIKYISLNVMGMVFISMLLRITIIICCFYILSACTPRFVINLEGYPSPEEFDTTWTSDRSISAMWFFSRWYKKKIESKEFSEYIDYPQHLSPESINVLPNDTKYVVVNIRIYNFKRKRYRLVKCFTIGSQYVEEPIGDWTIREYLQFSASGPVIPDKEISLFVKLLSGESDSLNETIISTSQLQYFIGTPGFSNSGEIERR